MKKTSKKYSAMSFEEINRSFNEKLKEVIKNGKRISRDEAFRQFAEQMNKNKAKKRKGKGKSK